MRLYRLSERQLGAFEDIVAVYRFINVPLGLRIDLEQRAQLVGQRGRRNCLRQDANACALDSFLRDEGTVDRIQEVAPGTHITEISDGLRAIGIVHTEDGSLRENIRPAQTCGMLLVAFNLGGTIELAFDQNRTGVSAERECAGIKHRTAGDHFFRLAHVGDNRFQRLLGAGGHASHGQRCAHQFQETASGDGIQPLRGALGKFAVQHFLKFRASRQLFQAAPVLGALSFGQMGASGLQVKFVFLAGTNIDRRRIVV